MLFIMDIFLADRHEVCWRNWIAHLTTDQEVLGSSPRWIVFLFFVAPPPPDQYLMQLILFLVRPSPIALLIFYIVLIDD
jgi:hypothetical protein